MDLVEAKKNLDLLHQDKERLESLNQLNSTFQFVQTSMSATHSRYRQEHQQHSTQYQAICETVND